MNRLDERWGAETSAKGTRFKLNRDMAGYFLTNRAEISIEEVESKVRITLPNPEKLRTLGELVSFENVGFRHPPRSAKENAKWLLDGVTFTVGQGGRAVFVGAVSLLPVYQIFCAHESLERTRQINPGKAYSGRTETL